MRSNPLQLLKWDQPLFDEVELNILIDCKMKATADDSHGLSPTMFYFFKKPWILLHRKAGRDESI